jgi:hypothetical protein
MTKSGVWARTRARVKVRVMARIGARAKLVMNGGSMF